MKNKESLLSSSPAVESQESLLSSQANDSEDLASVSEAEPRRRSRPLLIAGYILMALGVIASIVALCIPLRFLIGLGIGVLMLGLATTYSAIPR